MWLGSVYIDITFFLTVSASSDKYIQFPIDLLILAFPSVPGNLPHVSFLGITASGSTKTSPYKLLKLLTISLVCSIIGSWSSPTGTVVALNAVISAAWLTGYIKNPAGILFS